VKQDGKDLQFAWGYLVPTFCRFNQRRKISDVTMSCNLLTLLAAIVFTVAYLILAVRALSYVNQEERARGSYWLLIMDPWWPFHNKSMRNQVNELFCRRILCPSCPDCLCPLVSAAVELARVGWPMFVPPYS